MIISIIGIGLIGGSLAIALKENGFATHIIGVDSLPGNVDKAIRRRLIDEEASLEEAVRKSQLIVLATPVDVLHRLLPTILDLVDNQQVVMDVGSTKKSLADIVRHHPTRGRYVATHPMAGTEYSGPEAALPGLFNNKCTVLCELTQSDADAVAVVRAMYASIPMRIIEMEAADHDLHAAYVSHISHISSFALALTVLEKERDENRIFQLASGGFDSTVRLAKSASNMWIPIFQDNRDHVLDVLDEHISQLSRFRTLLIKRDFETFRALIEEANKIRKILS